MTIKSTLYSLGAIFFSINAYGQQHQHDALLCGTPEISLEQFKEPIAYANQLKASQKNNEKDNSEIRYVPVKVHLLGNDDGTRHANENSVNNMLAILNKSFKANKIEFYFAGTSFNKYNDTKNNTKADKSGKEEQKFHNTNGAKDAINLYISSSLNGVGGYAFITPRNQNANRIHVVTSQANDNKTTPHEFGHYFGLSHTFQHSNAKKSDGSPNWNLRELVTRNKNEIAPRLSANCSTAGDFLCDTEADPYGVDGYKNQNCVVTTEAPDANGDAYRPNMGNFMNYSWCPDYNFSEQQVSKMNDGYTLMNNKTTFFTAPETEQPAPTNLEVNVGDYAGDINISWTDNSSVETGYIIEAAEKGTDNFIPVAGVAANTQSYKVTQLARGKEYVFRLKPSNSKQNYSAVSDSFTTPTLCSATKPSICVPAGRAAAVINNLELSKGSTKLLTNNNSSCTGNATVNYFNTHQANVTVGDKIDIQIKSQYGNGGSFYKSDVKVYIDWNNDNIFDEDEKTELIGSGIAVHTFNHSFTVPEIPSGIYRLRAVINFTGSTVNACTGNEMEDYALVVTNPTLSTIQNEYKHHNFEIYPNPVHTQLSIKNIENYVSFEIYDVSGKLLRSAKIEGKSIPVNDLSSGLYIIIAMDKDGNKFTSKFIKK